MAEFILGNPPKWEIIKLYLMSEYTAASRALSTDFVELQSLVTFSSGGTPSKQNSDYWGGNHPWVSAKDLKRTVITETVLQLTDKGFNVAKLAPKGALLVLVRGMTLFKNVPICMAGCELSFNQDIKALVVGSSVIEKYLLYYLQGNRSGLMNLVDSAGHGTGRLNTELLKAFAVRVPPLPEQKAIAGVLETWDGGIRQLEAKIAAKRRVKKGLMQELLSGKRRLPGFDPASEPVDTLEIPQGWRLVKLGDIFRFLQSHAFSRDNLTTAPATGVAGVFNIHYGDIHATYEGPLLDLQQEARVPRIKILDQLPTRAEMLEDGDLVMADASEDHAGVGACVELVNLQGQKVTGGLHTFVLRDVSKETVLGFRGYLFQEYHLAKELKRISTGASVYGISKTNLAKVLLTVPPLEEQKAIVKVLNAADRELDALERKLKNWKVQKKYLLYNLVDGTIRLPEFIEPKSLKC